MAIQFERSALYDEVWTAPLTKLGLKYGMSDMFFIFHPSISQQVVLILEVEISV